MNNRNNLYVPKWFEAIDNIFPGHALLMILIGFYCFLMALLIYSLYTMIIIGFIFIRVRLFNEMLSEFLIKNQTCQVISTVLFL